MIQNISYKQILTIYLKANQLAAAFFSTTKLNELRAATREITKPQISGSDRMVLGEIFHVREIQRRYETRYPGELADKIGFHMLMLSIYV